MLFTAKSNGAGPEDALLYTQVSLGSVWLVAAALVLHSSLCCLCYPNVCSGLDRRRSTLSTRIGYPPFIHRFDLFHSTHRATSYFSTNHICKLSRRKHGHDPAKRG